MIKAIVIDDQKHSRDILENMLQQHFKNVELVAVCKNAEEGKAAIENMQPDLVLTDIELEKKAVFDMLQQLNNINFEIIFITAYEQYAIQANEQPRSKLRGIEYKYTKTIATDLNGTFCKPFYRHLVHEYIFELSLRLRTDQPC